MKVLLSVSIAAFMVISGMESPQAAFLRGEVTVENDVIRLADLFAEAGERGDRVVASAPAPGRRNVIGAEELRRIARRAGLRWQPASRYDRVVVRRAARVVGTDELKEMVRGSLLALGMPKSYRIALSKSDMTLHAATDVSRQVQLSNPRYDARSGRFSAVFVVPTGVESDSRVQVTGDVYQVVDVPVLAARARRGEIIRKRDLTTVKLRRSAIMRDAILDPAEIVGMTPKRYLREGVPLRPADLQPPTLVHKGSLVTLTLRTDRMLITARARAIDSGARGEVVRVVNPRSKSTVEGVVAGPGLVTVSSPSISR